MYSIAERIQANSVGRRLAGWLIACAALAVAAALLTPFPQPESFHDFADQRGAFGVPHFANVVSNLAYLIAGLLGLTRLHGAEVLRHRPEQICALAFFAGAVLVAAGSGYYHWEPTTECLYWDRLAMMVTFMALVAFFVADRVDAHRGATLALPALILFGAACTTYWHLSQQAGAGDVRFYFLGQAIVIVSLPLLTLMFPGRLTDARGVLSLGAWYGAAIACEQLDHEIFSALGGTVSGHTIKHVLSAMAITAVLGMILRRARP